MHHVRPVQKAAPMLPPRCPQGGEGTSYSNLALLGTRFPQLLSNPSHPIRQCQLVLTPTAVRAVRHIRRRPHRHVKHTRTQLGSADWPNAAASLQQHLGGSCGS